MKNFIILLLTAFILSCATAPPQILDDGFISSQPNFQVQFHKPIIEKSVKSQRVQHGDIKNYYFFVNNTESILIQIVTYIQSRSGIDFYGSEQVLKNWGRMVLDPVLIDGHQWIKFVDVFNNNLLFTGYFRFMDTSFISVGRIYNAGADAEEIGSFRKGTSVKYGQGKLWDEAFGYTDQLFSIGKVATAEPESAHPDLSPAQQKSFNKYLDAERYPHFKAFAAEVDGDYSGWGWGFTKPKDAIDTAMQSCGKKGADCRLYSVGERVVINFSQDQLSNFLREYYEKVLEFGDLGEIKQHALSGDEINTLISGREGEGVTFLHGLKFTMRFMTSGRLMVRIIESKTALSPGNYGGEWWIEDDRYCRKYDKVLSGLTECFYVIKEENGIAFYTDDGAFNDRIRFLTPGGHVGKDIEKSVKATDQPKEKPKVASIPKDASGARVSLRREPMKISSQMKITKMLVEYDFFDNSSNPLGSFVNDLVDNNDGTVTDRATGLMWEKNGSNQLYNRRAKEYIERLNAKRFAGYSDWRMPTVEELASLLTRKKESGVHLNPVFGRKQSRCWTADKSESRSWSWYKAAWLIDFKNGGVSEAYWVRQGGGRYRKNTENYVKAVRSVK